MEGEKMVLHVLTVSLLFLGLWTRDADRLSMTDAEYQPPE